MVSHKFAGTVENKDGRKDIIIHIEGFEALIIRQEAYEKLGKTYEEMQDPLMMGAVLMAYGQFLVRVAQQDKIVRETPQ